MVLFRRGVLFLWLFIVATGLLMAVVLASGIPWLAGMRWFQVGPTITHLANYRLPHPLTVRLAVAGTLDALAIVWLLCALVREILGGIDQSRLRARAIAGNLNLVPVANVVPPSVELPDITQVPLGGLHTPLPGVTAPVTADAVGLYQGKSPKLGTFVRWEDARLLEVESGGADGALIYGLFGSRSRVLWADALPKGTPDELLAYQRAHAQLLALIHERTGLLPRTFSDKLRQPEASVPEPSLVPQPMSHADSTATRVRAVFSSSLFALILIVLVALITYAYLVLPLSRNVLLNAYAAGTVIFGALYLLRAKWIILASKLGIRRPYPTSHIQPPFLPGTPAQGRYALAWGASWWQRIAMFMLGVALIGSLAPFMFFSPAFSHGPETLRKAVYILALAPLLVVVNGGLFLILYRALWWTAHYSIIADETGLTWIPNDKEHKRTKPEAIPWDQVRTLECGGPPGQSFFLVTSALNGERVISWPEHPSRILRVRDAQSLTPLELAALVAARSGVPLEVAQ